MYDNPKGPLEGHAIKTRRQFLVLGTVLVGFGLPACATHLAKTDVAKNLSDDDEVGFMCPMHQDYTSSAAGTCPRCGMALVPAALFDMRDYRLEFQTIPAPPRAGEKLTLKFNIFHPGTGAPIKNFEVVHDKRYHLFVISQDMEFFEHIHPEEAEDGTWSVETTLPKAGYYAVLSDFAPSGGGDQFVARPLVTAGYTGDLLAQSAHLVPDQASSQTVDDLTAAVTYDPERIEAGSYAHMTFRLARASDDQPVTELQTYLGAFGHMLLMSEDMLSYVHVHPSGILSPQLNLDDLRGGPEVMFDGLLPKPGRYRAWTQFRYHDKVYTFTNTFEVFDGSSP